MAKIVYKEIISLSLKELQESFSSSCEHLKLNNAALGPQKENSIIIGNLTEVNKRKNVNPYSPPIMRFKMKEVLADGLGLGFEVIIYGKNVKNLDDIMKYNDDSPTTWIAFSNLTVTKFTGLTKPWSPFSLKVVDNNDEETRKQKVAIFRQSKKAKKDDVKYLYALIKDVTDKNRCNAFVVVKNVIKYMTVLNNNSKHTLLSIVDPSCYESSAKRKELLLHIFFNDSNDYFPEPIRHGDVLRLREMLGDFYTKEEKMYGKIFKSNAIVKFKLIEEGNEVTPLTSNSNYELTGQDRNIVKDLRHWWRRNCDCYDDEIQSYASVIKAKQICQIEKPSTFTLTCVIQNVRIIERHNVVILRVTDGTVASVFTTIVNIDDATQEFSSQRTPVDRAVIEATEIDVTIFKGLFEQAVDLKEGDFVELVNISCEDIDDGETNQPILDFFMRETNCEINILTERSCKAMKISNALEASRSKKIETLSGSNIHINEEVSSPSGSVRPSTSRRLERESTTKQFPKKRRAVEMKESSNDSPLYPVIVEDIDINETATEDTDLVGNEFGSRTKTVIESTSSCGMVDQRNGLNAVDDIGNKNAHRNVATSSNDNCQIKRAPTVKRKLSETFEPEPKRKLVSYVWQQQELNTVCNIYQTSSLTDFCIYSKGGDKCQVWAILKHIHYATKKPCNDCQYISCYHDWVWSLCSSCGATLSSNDIREQFPKEVLLKQSSLKCQSCSTPSSNDDPTVLPFIKLELCLEDTQNDNTYSVDLSGDVAELFFGVKPSFKWVVGPVSSILQERTNIYKQLNQVRPFQFCLVNRTKPDGTASIQICDTRLKF